MCIGRCHRVRELLLAAQPWRGSPQKYSAARGQHSRHFVLCACKDRDVPVRVEPASWATRVLELSFMMLSVAMVVVVAGCCEPRAAPRSAEAALCPSLGGRKMARRERTSRLTLAQLATDNAAAGQSFPRSVIGESGRNGPQRPATFGSAAFDWSVRWWRARPDKTS
jgi:hypothetical protein